MKYNPFSLTFGVEPKCLIDRDEQTVEVINNFTARVPNNRAFIITGVRGSGKTVLLTTICKEFQRSKDWIVVELNPESNMLESLAASIYEKSNHKFKFAKKEFSFSFKGLTFSISGENPVSNVNTLLERMLSVLKKNNKRVLVAIDDVYSNQTVKEFTLQFQILIRQGLPLFILMTGLYENVRNLQDQKTLTFLYRCPLIQTGFLDKKQMALSFENYLDVDQLMGIKLANLTNGYAYAYQLLGYIVYNNEPKFDLKKILKEFDQKLAQYAYDKIWADLPPVEKKIVIAIAKSENRSTGEVMSLCGFKKEDFSPYRDRLIKKGIVYSPSWGELAFALPRFKEYVLFTLLFEEN